MGRSQSARPQHTTTHRRPTGCWTGKRERHGELLSRLQVSNNVGGGSKEETFTALAAAFRFNDEVTDLFLKGPMESLADFQYYFTGEREIDEFLVSALGPETTPGTTTKSEPTQATRVKRAWRATRKLGSCDKDGNTLATIWADADYSAMEQVISQAKWQFSERYKIANPAKIAPADKLLFR